MLKLPKNKAIEIAFLGVFSAVILVLTYSLISMNGLVLGNDPAVHLERAQMFLNTGKIPLDNLGWTPPLYQIMLSVLIAFTGASSVEQLIFIVKITAVIVNWILFFAVYLIGARFFSKKVGALASVLLLLCYPMFEINLWGGYTSVLGIAFMILVFLYLPLAVESKGFMVVAGIATFALVLSHQLTLFVAVLILAPVMLFMIVKSRGRNIKALLFIIIGGGVAFFLYYFRAMFAYLGGIIEHVFFAQKAMLYQIPQTTLEAFWINFGFLLILGVAGLFVAAYKLWLEKKHVSNLTMILSLIIPFILTVSYLFGLYLPFGWFVYYIMPPLAIFSAVLLVYLAGKALTLYSANKKRVKPVYLKAIVIGIVVLSCVVLVLRADLLYGRINGGATYYSTSDVKALEAGEWLKKNYPEQATVVVTYVPGFWFRIYCGKTVIAATNPIVERNVISESVLDLSYEIETPLTLIRAYEAKGEIASEYFVSLNNVWNRASYGSTDGDQISYDVNGVHRQVDLTELKREYIFNDDQTTEKTLTIAYSNDEVLVTQILQVQNNSYPTHTSWSITPVNVQIRNVTLYLSTFFDLYFNFDQAYLPGILNWENPWANPSSTEGTKWAVTDFSKNNITDNYLALQDTTNKVYYAMEFEDLPDWGNIGVLANMQIDAIRLRYDFETINPGESESFAYQTLSFAESSFRETHPDQLKDLFTATPTGYYVVKSRDYFDYIKEHDVAFIVYDRNQLDTKLVRSKLLELIYSNDRYVIFKINNPPQIT
jgi:hypothetical protein